MDAQLTPELLAEWYPKGLYIINEESKTAAPEIITEKRKYLVISSEELSNQLLDLLSGIMGACKIDMNKVNVITFSGDRDYKILLEKYGATFILMFGIEPLQLDLPIVFPNFQLQQFSNASWVSSPDLSVIHNDKLMKSKLWLCLKQAFSL
jgi:hypothetical protein